MARHSADSTIEHSSTTNERNLSGSQYRSIDDYDTRFDQSAVYARLTQKEILADQKRWSGVSRPVHLPSRQNITAGYTPLPIEETPESSPSSPFSDHQEELDRSERPTTPPQGVAPVPIGAGQKTGKKHHSIEDQAMIDEIHQMVAQDIPISPSNESMSLMKEQGFALRDNSSDTHLATITPQSSSHHSFKDSSDRPSPVDLPKMSFSQLSELSCSQVGSTSIDLLNPTLIDERFWDEDH